MKRSSHHPNQLSLDLEFIRRIVCAGAPAEISSGTSGETGKNCRCHGRKSASETPAKMAGTTGRNCRLGEADAEKISFGKSLEIQRKRHGFNQSEAAEVLDICERTLRDWERGKVVPSKAVQNGAIDALRTSRRSPGKAKLDRVKELHHLDWEREKGWRLRVTVEIGRKVVGKRISLRLGTYTLDEAIQRKKLTLGLLARLGLTVRQRVQSRKATLLPK